MSVGTAFGPARGAGKNRFRRQPRLFSWRPEWYIAGQRRMQGSGPNLTRKPDWLLLRSVGSNAPATGHRCTARGFLDTSVRYAAGRS